MNGVAHSDQASDSSTRQLVQKLYEAYAGRLLAYTRKRYSIGEDDAVNLVYKTIYRVAAVNDRYTFENEHKEAGFIFKTHINYLRNYFRDTKSFENLHRETELTELADHNEPERPVDPKIKLLNELLDQLEDWQRVLLLMRGQEMPYSEIAKFVNKPEKQLKVYYARLKKQLLADMNRKLNSQNDEKE